MNNKKQELFGQGYFDTYASAHGAREYSWGTVGLYLNAIANAICEAIKPSVLLDIGCAKGYLVYLLSRMGIDAYGVDISPYAISQAPEDIRGKLSVLDIEEDNFMFPDSHFDLIVILEVLEHLSSFGNLMLGIKRMIKSGGYAFITTPTPNSRNAKKDNTHINVQSRVFWKKLFATYGFSLSEGKVQRNFKLAFLREMKKIMPDNPPSTRIGAICKKMGRIGNLIRNNAFPYIDYFSACAQTEVIIFTKVK